MKTRRLLVAASVLLGGAYVAAQVETPSGPDAAGAPDEVSASTSPARPGEGMEEDGFESTSSTSTRVPSDRERREDRRREGAVIDDDEETDAGPDSDPDYDEDDVKDPGSTRPQRP